MGTHTPWGMSDSSTKLATGIISYSTPGHGGIHVSPTLNQQVHLAWRSESGWYEEDSEWAIVAFHFPSAFKSEHHAMAIKTLKNWRPYDYRKVTGKKVKPSESSTLRDDIWHKKHENHWIVLSAWGDWHKNVPDGMVGVVTRKGGFVNGHYLHPEEKYFLIPKEEYTIPFAIEDESKYKEVAPITGCEMKKRQG
jgi:hypothetical protein